METPMKSFGTNFGNFFDEYVLTDFLGSGSYSVCKLGEHKATGQKFAVKVSGYSTISLKRSNKHVLCQYILTLRKQTVSYNIGCGLFR